MKRLLTVLVALAFVLAAQCQSSAAPPRNKDPIADAGVDWVATFPAELYRGAGRAVFTLRDAKDQELETQQLNQCRLIRKLGEFGYVESCRFEGSSVVCDGFAGEGLEPGEYELEVTMGGYGQLVHPFKLKRGEQLKQTLSTKTWRRIVTLHFVDAADQAIQWLPSQPTYSCTQKSELSGLPPVPADVLRAPPGSERGRGGFAYRRARGGGGGERFKTNDGLWYVRVFAGIDGKIDCSLGKTLFEPDSFLVEGTFEGPEWDDYKIVLTPKEGCAEVLEKRPALLEDNPGNVSLKATAIEPVAIDPLDESTVPKYFKRVVVKVNALVPVYAIAYVYKGTDLKTSRFLDWLQVKPSANSTNEKLGWIDVKVGQRVELRFWSPVLLVGDEMLKVEPGEHAVTVVERNFDNLCELNLNWPSESCKAAAGRVGARLSRLNTSPMARYRHPTDKPLSFFVARSAIEGLNDDVTFTCDILSPEPNPMSSTGPCGVAEISKSARKKLIAGIVTLDAKWSGLIWRTVGPNNEALPWVEASLLTEEEAEVGIKIRATWKAVRKQHLKANESYQPDFAKELEEVQALRTQQLELRHLETFGAWYNSRIQAYTTGAGYGYVKCSLKPDQRYVLFLWSRSRDELEPDMRIDFVAAGGLVDLGLIALPGYSK